MSTKTPEGSPSDRKARAAKRCIDQVAATESELAEVEKKLDEVPDLQERRFQLRKKLKAERAMVKTMYTEPDETISDATSERGSSTNTEPFTTEATIPLMLKDDTSGATDTRSSESMNCNTEHSAGQPSVTKTYDLQLRYCDKVITELFAPEHQTMYQYFTQSIDPVTLNASAYFKNIRKPMDLSTIQTKLKTKMYEQGKDFEDDFRLMFKNCSVVSHEDNPVYHQQGQALQNLFDKLWTSAENPVHMETTPKSRTISLEVPLVSPLLITSASQYAVLSKYTNVAGYENGRIYPMDGSPFSRTSIAKDKAEQYVAEIQYALRFQGNWSVHAEPDGDFKRFTLGDGKGRTRKEVEVWIKKSFASS